MFKIGGVEIDTALVPNELLAKRAQAMSCDDRSAVDAAEQECLVAAAQTLMIKRARANRYTPRPWHQMGGS